jgi:hypothetical protein
VHDFVQLVEVLTMALAISHALQADEAVPRLAQILVRARIGCILYNYKNKWQREQ